MPLVPDISEESFDGDSEDELNIQNIPSSSTRLDPRNVSAPQTSTLRAPKSRKRRKRGRGRNGSNMAQRYAYNSPLDAGPSGMEMPSAGINDVQAGPSSSSRQPQPTRLLDILPALTTSSTPHPESQPMRPMPRPRRQQRVQTESSSVDSNTEMDMSASRARDEEIRALLNLPMMSKATTNHLGDSSGDGPSTSGAAAMNGQEGSGSANLSNSAVPANSLQLISEYQCPICFSPPTQACLTGCGHVMCAECLFSAVRSSKERHIRLYGPGNAITWPGGREADGRIAKCPVCRAVLKGWNGR
ncbi:hypothetical protein FRC17_008277, partial [Serendipita sp. 399]